MKRNLFSFVIAVLLGALIVATPLAAQSVQAKPNDASCWGQASKVFAKTGAMGEHSKDQANPRLGLRNLARLLYEANVIPDDSMGALGVYVANELGLDISACMD